MAASGPAVCTPLCTTGVIQLTARRSGPCAAPVLAQTGHRLAASPRLSKLYPATIRQLAGWPRQQEVGRVVRRDRQNSRRLVSPGRSMSGASSAPGALGFKRAAPGPLRTAAEPPGADLGGTGKGERHSCGPGKRGRRSSSGCQGRTTTAIHEKLALLQRVQPVLDRAARVEQAQPHRYPTVGLSGPQRRVRPPDPMGDRRRVPTLVLAPRRHSRPDLPSRRPPSVLDQRPASPLMRQLLHSPFVRSPTYGQKNDTRASS